MFLRAFLNHCFRFVSFILWHRIDTWHLRTVRHLGNVTLLDTIFRFWMEEIYMMNIGYNNEALAMY